MGLHFRQLLVAFRVFHIFSESCGPVSGWSGRPLSLLSFFVLYNTASDSASASKCFCHSGTKEQENSPPKKPDWDRAFSAGFRRFWLSRSAVGLSQGGQQLGMDRGGGGGDLAALGEGGLAALRGGDHAARLPDQEHPGGVVPGLEPVLHKAVQAARGQVAQLQRGRADPADVVAAVIEQAHPPEGPVGQLPAAGVGARGAEALPQGGGGADMDGPPAAEGALPPAGSEQLAGVGVVDDAQKDASLLRQSQGDGAVAQVVEQIGGAVHRVQDPNWAGE